MQRVQTEKSGRFRSRVGVLFAAWIWLVPAAQAQFPVDSAAGHARIEGSVFIDGAEQPAANVRVDVRSVTGGDAATAFTDDRGRFQAFPTGSGSYLIQVRQQGYEPVEQRVDLGFPGYTPGLVITLKKTKAYAPSREGYMVSVHDLSVPGKAKRAYEKGLDRLQKKDLAGGLAHFKEATNTFPDYYEAYYQIGLAELQLRRDDEAEEALQRAIDLSGGGYAEPQFALGALLCDRHAFVTAERVLRRAIEVDATSWKGYLFLGQALFGLNRLVEAEKSAREALLRNASTPSAYLLLANIYIRRHEYVTAVDALDTFLKLRPEGSTSDEARAVRAAASRISERLKRIVRPPLLVY